MYRLIGFISLIIVDWFAYGLLIEQLNQPNDAANLIGTLGLVGLCLLSGLVVWGLFHNVIQSEVNDDSPTTSTQL